MKCPNCGSESQGKFCKYCGTPLTQETQQQKNYEEQDGPAVKTCPESKRRAEKIHIISSHTGRKLRQFLQSINLLPCGDTLATSFFFQFPVSV